MLSADAKQAPGVEMLAANAVAQPVVAQQQPVTREASANAQGGSTVSKTGKVTVTAAPAQDGAQTPLGTATADFARAVAAKGESAGSESNPDGQPQPETVLAAAKADAAAPALPQPIQSANSADTARATAPAAPAEPVIEARAGHLGQSLGVEIARKVELGEETLRIRLNPIELGRIEVTLNFDEKGSLQATVRTDSVQAMDLLRQDASDLARTLDQAGVRTDAQSFRFENRGGDSGGQQAQQQQQNRGQFASSDDDAGIAEPIYRPIRSDGQVDLLA
jgi:flagellar hook-length control protein FliK